MLRQSATRGARERAASGALGVCNLPASQSCQLTENDGDDDDGDVHRNVLSKNGAHMSVCVCVCMRVRVCVCA